jgi:4-diphosphocytidyl-2-C-methyl-D-erythritol kinase
MVPRKVDTSSRHDVGTTWEVAAPAKLNLYLEVLGKRSDGFHELETLLVPVRIYDELRWTSEAPARGGDGCSLSIDQQFSPAHAQPSLDEQDNLVLRAGRLLAERTGVQAHGHFHLTKRIPLQAGMGGGSSDAAATLLLANECWEVGLSNAELGELAAELGSDVPYFLNAGPAICRGRGERIEPLGGVPHLHFVLVKPAFGLSTPRVFAELGESYLPTVTRAEESASRLEKLIGALNRGAVGTACGWMTNRLEAAAARLAPEIPRINAALAQAGCWGQVMTGSGSTLVGIARSATQARRIARSLSTQQLGTVLATASGW